MEIRKFLHQNPAITIGACVVLVLIAGFYAFAGTKVKPTGKQWSGNVYFTADEGKTWEGASPHQIPPFTDSSGKTWVRAYVYECKDGKPFLAYMEMYPPAARARMGNPETPVEIMHVLEEFRPTLVVKKPGDANWVPKMYAQTVTDVSCAGGEKPKEVMPP